MNYTKLKCYLWIIGLFLILPIFASTLNSSIEAQTSQNIAENISDRVFTETPPPPPPVRPVAEFEPAAEVLIRYPLGIPTSLVAQLANTAQVVCIVASTSVQQQATSAFQTAGVNMANVTFLIANTNSYWTRDYGPWFVFNGNNELGIVDFPYNRPRPLDDEIPRTFAMTYNYPLYGMNLTNTGGNYMSDGINTAAQTTLVYEENSGLTQAQVNQKMLDYMGVVNYYTLEDPNNTYIDHIDCWGKFLAPDKVLIRSVPNTHSQYNAIESVANWFASQNCIWGYPYKVYRVYTPQNQPYTNSLILNKKVFVPLMNSSYDQAALQSYATALPGYEIIGVIGTSSAPWESTDALHCRTHEIPDRNMLFIHHQPLHHQVPIQPSYNINVYIYPYSNTMVYPDSAYIRYKINQGPWQTAALSNIGNNNYTTMLNGFVPGDTIRYYIHAADQSGRSINHPLTGALDPHKFWIMPDNIPPVITHSPISSFSQTDLPLNFSAEVSDNYAVSNVSLSYRIDDGQIVSLPMNPIGNNIYEVQISPIIPENAQIFSYLITATDSANPPNTTTFPNSGWISATIIPTTNQDQYTNSPAFALLYTSPNPLSLSKHNTLNIVYTAKANQSIKIDIFNIKGQLIYSKTNIAKLNGQQILSWTPLSMKQEQIKTGIYFIRLVSEGRTQTQKFLLVK